MGEDLLAPAKEVAWMRRLSAETGRPVTFALAQYNRAPEQWRELLQLAEAATGDGAALRAQVMGRPTCLLVGWQTQTHPFRPRPSYRAIAHLPLEARVERLRDPAVRAAILAERNPDNPLADVVSAGLDRIFPMGEPPDYEPPPERSVAAMAAAEGRPAEEVLYDLMMGRDGKELLMLALLGYSDGNLDAMREMLLHPNAALGLSDGGAHCGAICDASMPTFMLSHWARDRRRGPTLDLAMVVRKMTYETAQTYGLEDRGVIAAGAKADLNLIDFERLDLRLPKLVFDLPGGARRLVQEAQGYVATFVSGSQTMAEGEDTGARPGRLVRGK
jgi:N-acyl-D-amino-acid deacylase